MIKSYKLKIYANKGKKEKLDNLLSFWQSTIQEKINLFWVFDKIKGLFCPSNLALGGRLIRDASIKAWQISKGAKRKRQEKPIFKGDEIDLNLASIKFLDFQSKEFDFWVKITHLEKGKRLVLPCKKTGIFNKAMEIGKLKNSAKLLKRKNNYYLQVYVEMPEIKRNNINKIAIDIGLNNSVVTSNGDFLGKELKDLRIKTKWRNYEDKISPFKQGLNKVAKELIKTYPETDFVVENLLFKGKKKRNKTFRRRNSNWAYMHLGKMLDRHGILEGFKVFYVNPALSSQTCPACSYVSELNRVDSSFNCRNCGYKNHADIVGAINLIGRVNQEFSVPVSGGNKCL